jgi:AbiV family abortive infection protein
VDAEAVLRADRRVLVGYAADVAENARGLLDDARLLLDAGRPPRAHALATLALEEIGQASLCILALFPWPKPFYGSSSKGSFWAAWKDHADKLGWALGFLGLIVRDPTGPAAEAIERLVSAAREGHLRKLGGFYVDYRDGKILFPVQVGAAEARQIADDARALLDVAAATWLADGLAERARELDQHRDAIASLQEQLVQAVMADAEGLMASFRQFFRDQRPVGDEP